MLREEHRGYRGQLVILGHKGIRELVVELALGGVRGLLDLRV